MRKIIIVAMTQDRVIGKNGEIPWHYPSDFKHFKQKTTGHPVVMGSSTYRSLPDSSRPLENRKNIVLTRSGVDLDEEFVEVSSLEEAWEEAEAAGTGKVFIAGGESVYRQTLDEADEMIITIVPDEVDGDSHFPDWKEENWEEVTTETKEKLRFHYFERKR